jgi:PEP-CTERM motif
MTSSQSAPSRINGREKWIPIVIAAIFVAMGFARLEDRSILEIGGDAANAMAAVATLSADDESAEEAEDQPYITPIAQASRLSRPRARRILRDTILPANGNSGGTTRVFAPNANDLFGPLLDTGAGALEAFALGDNLPELALASAAPSLARNPSGIFASGGIPDGAGPGGGGGDTGSGGTDSGNGGGGDGLVPAVPEPSTWMMLLLGFFMLGSMLRHRNKTARGHFAHVHSGA